MSLRTRLVLAVTAVALVALLVAGVATYSSLRSFLYSRIDQSLTQTVPPLNSPGFSGGFGNPASPGGTPTTPTDPNRFRYVSTHAPGTYVEVRSASGAVVGPTVPAYQRGGEHASPALPKTITGFTKDAQGQSSLLFTAPSAQAGGAPFRVLAVQRLDGDTLILGISLADTNSTLHRLLLIEIAVALGALLTAALVGWWLVQVGLRPLRDVEDTAEAIAEGKLTERVPGDNERTEVGRLARTVNLMLNRIESAFAQRDRTEHELRRSEERLRRFVADASHELRTPVAAVSAYAELFERGASTRPEDLHRVVTGIRTETDRMSRLVSDLLLLARLDEGRPMELTRVELVSLAAESVQTAEAVGPQWPVTLRAERPVEVLADASQLRQVLDNLLGNVRSHTPQGTATIVSVDEEEGDAVVRVADQGPGISDEDRARIFERFYRADPSRSRSNGGSGLGLSIVAALVKAHGGRVGLDDADVGTTIAVHLPLADGSDGRGGDEAVADAAHLGPVEANR